MVIFLSQLAYDIDTQSNSSHILVEWFGFTYVDSDTFEIGLGTEPGTDNIISFQVEDMAQEGNILLSGLSLQNYQVN